MPYGLKQRSSDQDPFYCRLSPEPPPVLRPGLFLAEGMCSDSTKCQKQKDRKMLILKGIFSSMLAPIDLMSGSSFGYNNIATESSYLRLELERLIIVY